MNQASVKSFVVPVLPAMGRFRLPRPRRGARARTTPRSSDVRMKAVSARSASVAPAGVASSITLPSRSVMRSMRNGFMRRPWFAKVAKAATIS